MVQYLIVGLIVAAAVCYSCWLLMPASWRRAGAARLAARAARNGLNAATAARLQVRLERAGACGDCASCKGCTPASSNPRG